MLIGQIEYELLEANLWYLGQAGYVDLEAASEYQASQESDLETRSAVLDQDDPDVERWTRKGLVLDPQ
ncbi:hypothetical protein [Egbenema bharatensis]|uniref:hypothetical protein n=1 Tax=Egbenema bharatensis TaxID=3463334 RepID=UPI003A89C8AB